MQEFNLISVGRICDMASGILLNDKGRRQFFWSVDAHVGPGCPNRDEDVQLIQFGYFCMAKNPGGLNIFTPAEGAIIESVVPGAKYSGQPADPLTFAIRAHQRIRKGTQDGKVSPIQNSSGAYHGNMTWMVIPLNVQIMDANSAQWPILHKMANCPPALAQASRHCFQPFPKR
ncbi:MAG: hypothetical protein K7J46_16465 [Bryobacter sp.]|nr:hypothetical protein [Bryobacter sp. CoA8 C33]